MARRRALDFVNISLPSTTTQFLRAFIPQAFALCPYCPLVIDLISMPPAAATAAAAAASSDPPGAYSYGPPRVVFSSNNASIVIDGSFMRVSAVPRPNATAKRARGAPPRPIELFSLALYAEGGLYNFSIVQSLLQLVTLVHFDLQPLSNVAVTVKTSRVGKIHVGLLGKAVAHLMNTLVIPLINDVFPGIPVLKLGNVTLSQPYVSVGAGEMVLGVDVALPVV